jgi:hypothetical protein
MKKILLFILTTILFVSEGLANPYFTIGSNVYYTIFGYPHDLLKWSKQRSIYIILTPQTLPWQGDVTNMNNKPSDSYTSTYQSVEFETPNGYTGDPNAIKSWMNLSSYAYKDNFQFGAVYRTDFGTFLAEISRIKIDMELTSNGTGRAYETVGSNTTYYMVPFDAATYTKQNYFDAQVIYANRFFDIPFGFKLAYQNKTSDVPWGHLNFTDNGTYYQTNHLTWGWATFGCAKIFGYSHINSDAFFENSYTVYNGDQIDAQASFELGDNYKTGIRYRRVREDGDYYSWKDDATRKNYGDYIVDAKWKNAVDDDLIRAYSKINFINFRNAKAGILFFLQYDRYTLGKENKLVESDPISEAKIREFTIEINPFLNYKLDNGYVDCGILIEFSKAKYDNTQDRWNSVAGLTQKSVYWETTPNNGWDESWESFSKGSHWYFSTGIEVDPSINIYKGLNLDLRLTILKKFTFQQKIYGKPVIPSGSNSYDFSESYYRDNTKNETWVMGEIGFQYKINAFDVLFGFQTPTAYLLQKKTKLSDGNKQLFEHEKINMWQVQTPSAIRLQVVCDFDFSKGFDF